MNSETDKEDRSCNEIFFLSEIIADFRFWQELRSSFGLILIQDYWQNHPASNAGI